MCLSNKQEIYFLSQLSSTVKIKSKISLKVMGETVDLQLIYQQMH